MERGAGETVFCSLRAGRAMSMRAVALARRATSYPRSLLMAALRGRRALRPPRSHGFVCARFGRMASAQLWQTVRRWCVPVVCYSVECRLAERWQKCEQGVWWSPRSQLLQRPRSASKGAAPRGLPDDRLQCALDSEVLAVGGKGRVTRGGDDVGESVEISYSSSLFFEMTRGIMRAMV